MNTADPSPSSVHRPPPGARLMNVLRWSLFAFLVVLALVSIGSYVASLRSSPSSKETATKAVWHCPMHPNYTSDRPGDCPICGMSLVRVEGDGGHAASDSAVGAGNVDGLTSIHITPERIQRIGVRTAVVERSDLGASLRLVGFVTQDESRVRRVQIRVSGWIQKLYANQTGAQVRAGQPLLSIYSPELFQSEQEYLIQRDAGGSGAGAAAERLRRLGVPDDELRRLESEGTASSQLVLRSPVSGTVLERGALEGQYVGAETPLFTVADLSRVWVLADLYEMDMARVHVGDVARFTADALPDTTFVGRIEFVSPTVSSESRTLKARVSLPNADGALRPGMFGRIRVRLRGGEALLVPSEAVVDAGDDSYLFLAHADGHFEPRHVVTGRSQDERIEILGGVAEGDTVVASASFLIDSESRLKAAIAGMGASSSASHPHGTKP